MATFDSCERHGGATPRPSKLYCIASSSSSFLEGRVSDLAEELAPFAFSLG